MQLATTATTDYLAADAVIDFDDADVAALARSLREEHPPDAAFAAAAYGYVRDRIAHAGDIGDPRVTLSASETLREGVGLCFSKSHLLTAVLRAQGVPAGLCYQRLTDDGERFDLHGLIAVYLDDGWHRQDPRGNRAGVEARFSLGREQLAWEVRPELGEYDDPRVFSRPHPAVVAGLAQVSDIRSLRLPSTLEPEAGDGTR